MVKVLKNLYVAFCAVLVLTVSGLVHAQSFDMTDIGKLPHFYDMTIEDFYAASDAYEETPPGDPHLAYRVRLPIGWTKLEDDYETISTEDLFEPQNDLVKSKVDLSAPKNNEVSQKILGMISKYYGPFRIDATSRFEIKALQLEHGITAKNWFTQYILANGFILQGMEEYNKGKVEGLYVLVEGDYSYVVRTVAEINGSRMTLASYYLPEKYWDEEKAIQEQVIRNFRFTNAKTEGVIELTRSYEFLDLVAFDYPSSWRLMAPSIMSIEGMDVKLVQTVDQKTLAGEINVHIVSTELDTTLAQEIQNIKGEIAQLNLKVGDKIDEPADFDFHNHIYFNRVEVYSAKDQRGNLMQYEYWLAILAESRYYYLVTMLTPGRESDFQNWARNIEAFEIVLESIRPGD